MSNEPVVDSNLLDIIEDQLRRTNALIEANKEYTAMLIEQRQRLIQALGNRRGQ